MIEDTIFRLGIPTYKETITTLIPTSTTAEFKLFDTMPTGIGRIYGMSIYADSVSPENNPLITSVQAQNLYLSLKIGNTDFVETIRLDDLLFKVSGVPTPSLNRYLPVNIPKELALDKSRYINPTGIVSPAAPAAPLEIMLNLFYISDASYQYLVDIGFIGVNGKIVKQPEKKSESN